MRTFVRVTALVLAGLCLVSAICARLPGYQTYRDRNDCADKAWGNLMSFEHDGDARCEPDWLDTGTRPAADWGIFVAIVPMLAIALALARRPSPGWAVAWSAVTIAGTILWIVATFSLGDWGGGSRTEELAPTHVLQWSFGLFYAVHAIQIVTLGIWSVVQMIVHRQRRRANAIDPMPKATVVDR
jgi:hypothetical protein